MLTFGNIIKIINNIILKKCWQVLVCLCAVDVRGLRWRHLARMLLVILAIIYLIFYYRTRNRMAVNPPEKTDQQERGPRCEPEKLDPFSEEAMRFDQVLPKIVCSGTDWVKCVRSECHVVPEILKAMKNVVCYYRDVIYVNDQLYLIDEPVTVKGQRKYKLNKSDHVKVHCTGNELNSASRVSSRWHGLKAGFRPLRPKFKPDNPTIKSPYNVMIFCLHSTSHNGFIRKMPKSYKFLSEKAVILNSYNVVGDGTSAALFPILTGKAEEELRDRLKIPSNRKHVNARNFIFHQLKGYGYRTAYFEDMSWIGDFQHGYDGFARQPADHYLRAFFQEKNLKGDNGKYCIGSIPQYQFMLNLSLQFLLKLDGRKFAFTFISDITHDNFDQISTADEDLVSTLQNLVRNKLKNTLVIVMGDHGTRFNGIRNTYQGKLEERLPLMAIMLPKTLKRLRAKAVTSLEHNRDVLTTPFDIHATILDVIGINDKMKNFYMFGSDLPRAMSLLKPIPASRTCSEAGVMPHYCSCTKWYNVSYLEPMYHQIGSVLAEKIDGVGREQPSKCAPRKLTSIEWVLQRHVNLRILKHWPRDEVEKFLGNPKALFPKADTEYYQAKIVMSPGSSVFEGTISYSVRADVYTVNHKEISRVNAYGNESSCVVSMYPHLRPYCYCREKLAYCTASGNETQTTDLP